MSVATTILEQLGNRTFILLTGAKDLVSRPDGLGMRIGKNAKKVTHVRITLTDRDDYRVEFMRWNARATSMAILHTAESVYCDQLKDTFEAHTGLYVTLGARR